MLPLLFLFLALAQSNSYSWPVWVEVLVFGDATDGSRQLCAASKVALYQREKMTRVSLVTYEQEENKTYDKGECKCSCKEINVLRGRVPWPGEISRPETFYLSHFDEYRADGIYPHIICIPEYRCIVTVRPSSRYYTAIASLNNDIEHDASQSSCDDPMDYRGLEREYSVVCLYLKDPSDCRPPQSWLEKVVCDQREWYMKRLNDLRETGMYNGPDRFVVQSALK